MIAYYLFSTRLLHFVFWIMFCNFLRQNSYLHKRVNNKIIQKIYFEEKNTDNKLDVDSFGANFIFNSRVL